MEDDFDMIKLIEKNAKTRLSNDYVSKLLYRIKKKFWDREQQYMAANFFCLYNYSKTDFIVDLDHIWKWLGYPRKEGAKRLLERSFVENREYKKILSKENNPKTGKLDEQILLTTYGFKKLCMKAETRKSNEIVEFYIRLEEFMFEMINDETPELRDQMLIEPEPKIMTYEEGEILIAKRKLEVEQLREEVRKKKEEYKKEEKEKKKKEKESENEYYLKMKEMFGDKIMKNKNL
jgi:hypothetical protein